MHNHDDKYPARPGFETGTSRLQAQSLRMRHRGQPECYMPNFISAYNFLWFEFRKLNITPEFQQIISQFPSDGK